MVYHFQITKYVYFICTYCTLPVYLLITYIYALLTYGKLCNTHNTSHSFERMHIYDSMIIHVHKYMIYIYIQYTI